MAPSSLLSTKSDAELRRLLGSRGLSRQGTRTVLIRRLEDHMASEIRQFPNITKSGNNNSEDRNEKSKELDERDNDDVSLVENMDQDDEEDDHRESNTCSQLKADDLNSVHNFTAKSRETNQEHTVTPIDPFPGRTFTSFDHSRMNTARYQDLRAPCYNAALMALVRDYTNYLRNEHYASAEETEMRSMKAFVEMIRNKVGWGLARLVVPEFKEPIPETLPENLSPGLADLLQRVRGFHESFGPQDYDFRAENVPLYERQLGWNRLSSLVACLEPEKGKTTEEVRMLALRVDALRRQDTGDGGSASQSAASNACSKQE